MYNASATARSSPLVIVEGLIEVFGLEHIEVGATDAEEGLRVHRLNCDNMKSLMDKASGWTTSFRAEWTALIQAADSMKVSHLKLHEVGVKLKESRRLETSKKACTARVDGAAIRRLTFKLYERFLPQELYLWLNTFIVRVEKDGLAHRLAAGAWLPWEDVLKPAFFQGSSADAISVGLLHSHWSAVLDEGGLVARFKSTCESYPQRITQHRLGDSILKEVVEPNLFDNASWPPGLKAFWDEHGLPDGLTSWAKPVAYGQGPWTCRFARRQNPFVGLAQTIYVVEGCLHVVSVKIQDLIDLGVFVTVYWG